jgi:hypothetical protein
MILPVVRTSFGNRDILVREKKPLALLGKQAHNKPTELRLCASVCFSLIISFCNASLSLPLSFPISTLSRF